MTFLVRAVSTASVAAAVVAVVLATGQGRFATATFEYGQISRFNGVLRAKPYPHLEMQAGLSALLVDEGKHGLSTAIDGAAVQLQGSRIHRDGMQMISVLPGSIAVQGGVAAAAISPVTVFEQITLSGEIADSKCYLGVMNPGEGKVHRDCAVRCLSGGIPPVLLVRDEAGVRRAVLLSGGQLGKAILDYVAEPVRVTGKLLRRGDVLELATESRQILRTGE